MDLLGSIMSSMDKPPSSSLTEEQKKRLKEQKLSQERLKRQQDQQISNFGQEMKSKIAAFTKDQTLKKITMSPMTDVFRGILHQMIEDAGLVSYSFGADGVDRHLVIWKKEFSPCEDELLVLRNGGDWNEEKAKQMKASREVQRLEASRPVAKVIPKSDYHNKYTHIIDLDVGRSAAQDVAAKSQYGNDGLAFYCRFRLDRRLGIFRVYETVTSTVQLKHKTDKRTIEETLAERKAKKSKMSDDSVTMVTKENSDMAEQHNQTSTKSPSQTASSQPQ